MKANGPVTRGSRTTGFFAFQLFVIWIYPSCHSTGAFLFGFEQKALSYQVISGFHYAPKRREWQRPTFSCDLPTPAFCAHGQQHDEENLRTDDKEDTESVTRTICISAASVGGVSSSSELALNFTAVVADLATHLSLPVSPDLARDTCHSHALVVIPYQFGNVTSYALAIQSLNHTTKTPRRKRPVKKTTVPPFFVDFCPPINSRLGRRSQGQSGSDLLIKAVSPGKSGKSTKGAIVYDLTAGFGQDSLLILQGGAERVHMVERDPIVAALLSDGLRRLNLIAAQGDPADPQTHRAMYLSSRLTLEEVGDATEVVQNILNNPSSPKPDVCYLDPMFPARTKSAAVKKNMQILHSLLGSQLNANAQNDVTTKEEIHLLDVALSLATTRVVVKRPIKADCLGGSSRNGMRSYAIKGSVNRWDVYLK